MHCIIRSWYFQEIAVKSIDIDGLFYPCNPAKAILPPDISDWELRFYFWSWRAFCKVAGPRLKHLVVRFISWVGCPGCDAENWGYSNSLILFVSLDIARPNLGSKSLQTHRGVKWCKYVGMFPWLAVHTSPFFWTWEFFVANLTAQQRITERRQSRSVSKSQVSQRKSTRHARRKREQKPATGSRYSVFFLNFLLHNQRISGPQNPNSTKIALRTPPVARSCDQSSHENVWVHRLALAPWR